MFGQGRPIGEAERKTLDGNSANSHDACSKQGYQVRGIFVCALLAVIGSTLTATLTSTLSAQQLDLRLRVAWGGRTAQSWHALFELKESQRGQAAGIDELTPLGLENDEPGSIYSVGNSVIVSGRNPTSYDAFDVRLRCSSDAVLSIQFRNAQLGSKVLLQEVRVADLVSGYSLHRLDDTGNQLLLQRAPADKLRLKFDRDTLVFSPGEEFEFSVNPHLTSLSPDSSYNVEVTLMPGRGDQDLWSEKFQRDVGEDGSMESVGPLQVPLPTQEGVYDVAVTVTPRRLAAPFVRTKPVLQRKMQLVVIDPAPGVVDTMPWEEQINIDPTNPSWWTRVIQAPQLRLLPGMGNGPLGNKKSKTITDEGDKFVELSQGGWQAYPLAVSAVGRPHILELEYAGNHRQKLGLSVIERKSDGTFASSGRDSGVAVSGGLTTGKSPDSKISVHRFVFWPTTESPLVVLTNLAEHDTARYGKFRVVAGPAELSPSDLQRHFEPSHDVSKERLFAATFAKPVFSEQFGAVGYFDEEAGRTLDDWVMFHQGSRRLLDYLKYAGYNSAVVAVLSDGSTLYPSRVLEPTPKFDSGVFFSSGQDPQRKDVLEMMFRMFDREQLSLIPAIEFTTPLPELEAQIRRGGDAAHGIRLVNERGISASELRGRGSHTGAIYNPLDPRVQDAMARVVQEVVDRYGHHPSFRGISINCGEESYTYLPGTRWALDATTVRRFKDELQLSGNNSQEFVNEITNGQHRIAWLKWRADKLSQLYRKMRLSMAALDGDAQLYINGQGMLDHLETYSLLSTPLVSSDFPIEDAMLRLGISPNSLNQVSGVEFVRGALVAPMSTLAFRRLDMQQQQNDHSKTFFARFQKSGDSYVHVPTPFRIDDFVWQTTFGNESVSMTLFPHLSPSQKENRRRFIHGLAQRDSQSIFDGGWAIPVGQESSMADLLAVYRQLPRVPFEDQKVESADQGPAPIVVRSAQHDGKTYFYVLNDSPWELKTEIDIAHQGPFDFTRFTQHQISFSAIGPGVIRLTVAMPPFGLVGGAVADAGLKFQSVQTHYPTELTQPLRHEWTVLLNRVRDLPHPPTSFQVLGNPGFETPGSEQGIPSWDPSRDEGSLVTLDKTVAHKSATSLKIQTVGDHDGKVTWVVSDPIQPPKTGRLYLACYARIPDAAQQPVMRLSILGKYRGEVYYRFGSIGAPTAETPNPEKLSTDWKLFVVPFDDFPAEGMSEMRVEFDLMSPGTIWVDDVELYDRWIGETEQQWLKAQFQKKGFRIDDHSFNDIYRFLDSYSIHMIRSFAHEPPVAAPIQPAELTARLQEEKETENNGYPVLNGFRNLIPKQVNPFR